jgi:hypothetical protein
LAHAILLRDGDVMKAGRLRTWGVLLGLAALACTGCTNSSQFAKLGPNTYSVTTHVLGAPFTSRDVQARNEELATNLCAESGRKMIVIDRQNYDGFAAQDRLKFRCERNG